MVTIELVPNLQEHHHAHIDEHYQPTVHKNLRALRAEMHQTNLKFDSKEQETISWKQIMKDYSKLTKEVILNSLSVIGSILVGYLLQTIIMHYVGQLDDSIATNTVGLSLAILNCCGGYFLMGVNQAIGSYIGRAYGAKNEDLVYNYYNKGFILVLAILSLFTVLVFYLKEVLILLGQKQQLAIQTRFFMMRILPGIYAQFIFDFLKNICNAQNIYNPPTIIQVITVFQQIFTSKYLIENYRLQGAVMSFNLGLGLSLLLLIIYMVYLRIFQIPSFSNISLNFKEFTLDVLQMAAPNQIDIMTFQINSILLGTLQNMPQFAAYVSIINFTDLVFSVPLGIGNAINFLVSNAIGREDTERAKKCYNLCIILQFTIGTFLIGVMYIFEDSIAAFYSSNQKIQRIIVEVLHIYMIGLIPDYLVGSWMSILKGIGKAKETIISFIFANYIVGIPTSVYFGMFAGYGVYGFWIGFDFSVFTNCICLLYILHKVDWHKQVQKMYNQLQKEYDDLANDFIQDNSSDYSGQDDEDEEDEEEDDEDEENDKQSQKQKLEKSQKRESINSTENTDLKMQNLSTEKDSSKENKESDHIVTILTKLPNNKQNLNNSKQEDKMNKSKE